MASALKVHEAMVRQVSADQKVSVSIDAHPGALIGGQVSQIAVMAEDGGWFNRDLRQYTVKVDLPPGFDEAIKPAMRCTGRVSVGHVSDTLAVHIQAVFAEGNEQFVYVASGQRKVRRQLVKIGQTSETIVAIREGLSEGLRVLLRKPLAGALATPCSRAVLLFPARRHDELDGQGEQVKTEFRRVGQGAASVCPIPPAGFGTGEGSR